MKVALTQFYYIWLRHPEMAAELNCEGNPRPIHLWGGKFGLLASLKETSPYSGEKRAWMRGRIRSGILHAIEEQTQQKSP